MSEVIAERVAYASTIARAWTLEGQRQSGTGQRTGPQNAKEFFYAGDIIVWHGGVVETLPALTRARVWQGSQAETDTAAITTFSVLSDRWISFLIALSGNHYICKQSEWAGVTTAVGAVGLEYHTQSGWRRYQPKGSKLPCLGASPTIQLVAGDPTLAGATVDGGIGVGRVNNPTQAVFGPDGMLYFIDAGTNYIRYLNPNPVSSPGMPVLGTSAVSLDRGTGIFYRENAWTFTIGPDGTFYMYLRATDDNDTQTIEAVNPDNTRRNTAIFFIQDTISPLLGQISNMFVSPDGHTLYVPCPKHGYATGSLIEVDYQITAIPINSDGTAGTGYVFAGNNDIPTHQFGGTNLNSQGEDVAATAGMVGDALNCYVAPNGDFYSIDDHTNMVRKVAALTGHIRSITNHQPLDSAGNPVAGGYSGDGSAAFTFGNNTAQFGFINGIAVDPCGNVFIGDEQISTGGPVGNTGLIRYIDTGGTLHTLAGQYPEVASNYPTTSPADARSKTMFGTQWINWGTDGCLYIVSGDNAIYKIASS